MQLEGLDPSERKVGCSWVPVHSAVAMELSTEVTPKNCSRSDSLQGIQLGVDNYEESHAIAQLNFVGLVGPYDLVMRTFALRMFLTLDGTHHFWSLSPVERRGRPAYHRVEFDEALPYAFGCCNSKLPHKAPH